MRPLVLPESAQLPIATALPSWSTDLPLVPQDRAETALPSQTVALERSALSNSPIISLSAWEPSAIVPMRSQSAQAFASSDPLTGIAKVQPALTIAEAQLQEFISSPHFASSVQQAFGAQAQPQAALHLLQQHLQAAPQRTQVSLTIAPSPAPQLQGAFAAQTNSIYLFDTFLQQSSPETIAAVYLEELGHWLDSQLNPTDSPGDEGAIFSALVQQGTIAPGELAVMQSENDWALWQQPGQAIVIEQAWQSSRQEEHTGGWLVGSFYRKDQSSFSGSSGQQQHYSEGRSTWSHDRQSGEGRSHSQISHRSAQDWGNPNWNHIDYRTSRSDDNRLSITRNSEARHFTPQGDYNPNHLRWSKSFSLDYGQWQTINQRNYASGPSKSVSIHNITGNSFIKRQIEHDDAGKLSVGRIHSLSDRLDNTTSVGITTYSPEHQVLDHHHHRNYQQDLYVGIWIGDRWLNLTQRDYAWDNASRSDHYVNGEHYNLINRNHGRTLNRERSDGETRSRHRDHQESSEFISYHRSIAGYETRTQGSQSNWSRTQSNGAHSQSEQGRSSRSSQWYRRPDGSGQLSEQVTWDAWGDNNGRTTYRRGGSISYQETWSPSQPGTWREITRHTVDANGDGINEIDQTTVEEGTIAPRPEFSPPPADGEPPVGNPDMQAWRDWLRNQIDSNEDATLETNAASPFLSGNVTPLNPDVD